LVFESSVGQKRERITVPGVELLVSASREAHAYQICGKNYQQALVLTNLFVFAADIRKERGKRQKPYLLEELR